MTRILCIEDEEDFRETLAEFLRLSGYDVVEAANGVQGLAAIQKYSPDLILCDINMPEMTGHELITKLRVEYPEKASIPFIFLTACGQKRDILTGHKLGADDYLIKPIDFDLLLSTIESRLERARYYRTADFKEDGQLTHQVLRLLIQQLRTPLNAVIGYADLMQSNLFPPGEETRRNEFLRAIQHSSYRLLAMMNNAMDSSAMLEGHHRLAKFAQESESLGWECIYSVQSMNEWQNATIDHEVEPDLPLIHADHNMLARALVGLLSDMIQFHVNEERIKMHIRRHGTHGISFFLRCQQPDLPLPNMEPLDLQFEEKNNSPLTPMLEHHGVNLFFAKSVVEAHGGNIFVGVDARGGIAVDLQMPPARETREEKAA